MEVAIIVIAICMCILTLAGLGAVLVLTLIGIRISGLLRQTERLLEDVRRDALPLLSQGRLILADVQDVSHGVRREYRRSAKSLRTTLQNVQDTSMQLRAAYSGILALLAAFGRLGKLLSAKRGRKQSDEQSS